MDLSPASVLRTVLISAMTMLVLFEVSERRLRQQMLGLLFRTMWPLPLVGVLIAIAFLSAQDLPQWWIYLLPLSMLLCSAVLWLPQQGARLSWNGRWEFREPAQPPAAAAGGLARPRHTRLRVLGFVVMLAGLAATTFPALVLERPDLTPDWMEPNWFLVGVTGMFVILSGGRVLKLARERQERELLSSPIRDDVWRGSVLWGAAWLYCLTGLGLTLGGLFVVLNPLASPWWGWAAGFSAMFLGGFVFTTGRKTFLRARRHRARVIASPGHLTSGSFVLYLRSFEADERQKALHEVAVPGYDGGMLAFVLSGRSVEEHIADVLAPVGPLVAVGAPGEQLPHVGAVRMYLSGSSDEAWQGPVRRLMRRSRLTVLTLGASEGTMWELAEAMRTVPPQRLILFVPAIDRDEYQRIRQASPRLPPAPVWLAHRRRETVQAVITFSEDWKPTLTPVTQAQGNPRWNLFTALVPALGPAFATLEAYEKRTGSLTG